MLLARSWGPRWTARRSRDAVEHHDALQIGDVRLRIVDEVTGRGRRETAARRMPAQDEGVRQARADVAGRDGAVEQCLTVAGEQARGARLHRRPVEPAAEAGERVGGDGGHHHDAVGVGRQVGGQGGVETAVGQEPVLHPDHALGIDRPRGILGREVPVDPGGVGGRTTGDVERGMPDQHVGRGGGWGAGRGVDGVDRGGHRGAGRPRVQGRKTATASGLARQPRLARMSRTAVAMGPTVRRLDHRGYERRGQGRGGCAEQIGGAARGCMAASRMVGAPGSEPGSATGSMATSAATGSTSTGAVVGSVTAGSTVVLCSSTVVDVVGASTTTANDRSVVGPRGRAVGSVLDDVATCGLAGVEGSSVLTAGCRRRLGGRLRHLRRGGRRLVGVGRGRGGLGIRLRDPQLDDPLRVERAFGAGRLVGLRGGRGRGRVRRALVGLGRRGPRLGRGRAGRRCAGRRIRGSFSGCAAATGSRCPPRARPWWCRDRSRYVLGANCPSPRPVSADAVAEPVSRAAPMPMVRTPRPTHAPVRHWNCLLIVDRSKR